MIVLLKTCVLGLNEFELVFNGEHLLPKSSVPPQLPMPPGHYYLSYRKLSSMLISLTLIGSQGINVKSKITFCSIKNKRNVGWSFKLLAL
jgi:hypothetical protein